MTSERFDVKRTIDATPAAIFAVLTDPRGHVAIDSSGSLQSAEGDRVSAVGDSFLVHMDRESLQDLPLGKYDVTVVITKFEADALIEWAVESKGSLTAHRYGYVLEAAENGTLVMSYYDWSQIDERRRQSGIFPVIPEAGIRATLGILARTVE
jgi:hypothetical protein